MLRRSAKANRPTPSSFGLALVFHQCPFCHKLNAAVEVSRQQVRSDVYSSKERPDKIPRWPVLNPGHPPPRDLIVYKILYHCKHCGKEWTKTSDEEVTIPRNYRHDEYGRDNTKTIRGEEDNEKYGPEA